jgi:7,8-dihydropterin-6-yl-methyl-4-(beta-D-ribofuranosyl)aminobenzene 5'-phosphate synthase
MKKLTLFIFFSLIVIGIFAQSEKHTVKQLKITILSTMLADKGIGEWGFSALVEADSVRILFDAGNRETTVLQNCKDLKVDLSIVPTLILSHNHDDHTGGWLSIRNAMKKIDPSALSITHVGQGFFETRFTTTGENKRRQQDSLLYVQTGGIVDVHNSFIEIYPGIYLTGPVPRKYPERNYPMGSFLQKKDADEKMEDNIPEDMSLVIQTDKGLVLLSGCGHSGIINTVTYVLGNMPGQTIYCAIGGFHLLQNTDDQIKWTAGKLKESGIRYFMGAHCTGIEPVYQIREQAGLKRGECVVGSVGAMFSLDKGFVTGPLTK